MEPRTVYVVVPGDIETLTGGYGYDRQIVAGLRRRGWTVHVVSVPGSYPEPSDADRRAASTALRALPDGSCVLIDGLALGALPMEAAAEGERLRIVALVHHPLGLETGIPPDRARELLDSERAALASARRTIVTSPRTVAAVESLGVPRERITVAEPGTEQGPLAPGSASGPTRLLCVATLVPRKGHDVLFSALEQLTGYMWHLTCVGSLERDIPYAAALRERCLSGALAGRVSLVGELAGAALDAAYASADLFVLPTHYEGYGMAVAEALARGIPVVSTRTGAIEQLVGTAAGVLVPPADIPTLTEALRILLADRARLVELREGAKAARAGLREWGSTCIEIERALDEACTQ